jgi:DNA-binding Lrp family transcriptional regulator
VVYIINEENLVSLYNSGVTIKGIAEKFKIPYKTVWRRLKKNSVIIKRKVRAVDNNAFSTYTRESCYWAGFIAADGNIRKDVPYVNITLASIDMGHLRKFKNFVNSNAEIVERNQTQKSGKITKCCLINIYSHQIKTDLQERFNIVPNKAKILKPPINIPKEFVPDFIRGHFDGDGSISWHKHNDKPRLEFSSGSKDFIEWVRSCISTLNVGNPSILMDKKWKIFKIQHMGYRCLDIMRWLYANSDKSVRLNRKFDRFINYEDKEWECSYQFYLNHLRTYERNMQIVNLRSAGLSYKKISKIVGVCQATCYNVIKSQKGL